MNTCRRLLATFCAASMLMTMPGVSAYAADLNHDEIIESCEELPVEAENYGDAHEDDSAYEGSENDAEAVEEPSEALNEIPVEPAENAELSETEALNPEEREDAGVIVPEEQEDAAVTVDLPEEYGLSTDDASQEEIGGNESGSYSVGDGVRATYDSGTGNIALYVTNAAGGTLWADWLERAGIDRNSVKSISVKQQKKVRLPADAQGFMGDNNYLLFGGLKNLSRIDFTGFDTSNVTNMAYMFFRCSSLKTLDLRSFKTSKVTNMRCMFAGCKSLKSVNLKSFNTSKVTNTHGMFDGCISLPGIDLSNFNTSNVTDMYRMFGDCTSLTGINLKNFDTSKVTSMVSMFSHCDNLTRLDLRSFNTSKVTNMHTMFSLCSKLKYLDLGSFNIPKGDKISNMLNMCNALEILITPKTIPGDQSLPYTLTMYDRNGKKYGKLTAKSGSIVLGKTKKLAGSFFIDVRDSSNSYYNAVNWAVEKGITNGYSNGTFGINRQCTRGEMVMLLWRFAGKPTPQSVSKSPFVDVPKSHTFYKAILWAYQKDIAKGYSDGKFGVNKSVSRGASMMFLWRLKGKPEPKSVSVSPFKDVPKNHVFYKAILWGYQKKITTGYTSGPKKGTFGINENCTRGQIVTFLYRARNLR